jgi:hypothetical protein
MLHALAIGMQFLKKLAIHHAPWPAMHASMHAHAMRRGRAGVMRWPLRLKAFASKLRSLNAFFSTSSHSLPPAAH